jgi:hypothetical protein
MGCVLYLAATISSQSGPFDLKIQVDVSRLFKIKYDYEDGDVLYDRLVLTLIPATVKHLEDTYQAYDTQSFITSTTPCNDMDMTKYENVVIEGNMMLIFNFEDVSAGYTAFAGVCKTSGLNSRPLVSYVYINLRNTILKDKAFTEKTFTTLLHEVHHGLGFLSGYLGAFWNRALGSYRSAAEVYTSSASYSVRMIRP